MRKVLKPDFFNRPTLKVTEELIGKFLVRKLSNTTITSMITEVEAYDGFKDKASHAHRGQTKRNFPMFGPPGVWYIYFTYGIHWLVNIVTGPEKYPAAVLIRGLENTNGPARLTKLLKIDGKLSNKPATRKTGLWIEDRGIKIKKGQILKTPRIGVTYAGPIWSQKSYRFLLKKSA